MLIRLLQPLAFSEIGRKTNNEDAIFPPVNQLTPHTRCFVLCDGMGGHERGEVAAEIVSSTLQPSLRASRTEPDIITKRRFTDALRETYSALDAMPVTSRENVPGTTMTCLYIASNGVLVAHIGDSRIYQVRPGVGILHKTWDHSLVNQLVKVGELTEEEAKTFPKRNVITRAMQPGLQNPYPADIDILTDIRGGDYFFMCSDGILENLDDEKLYEILSSKTTDEEKMEAIRAICAGNTRDNYTCILVPVASIQGNPLPTPDMSSKNDKSTLKKSAGASKGWRNFFIAFAITVFIIALLFFLFRNSGNPEAENNASMAPAPIQETTSTSSEDIRSSTVSTSDGEPGNIVSAEDLEEILEEQNAPVDEAEIQSISIEENSSPSEPTPISSPENEQ